MRLKRWSLGAALGVSQCLLFWAAPVSAQSAGGNYLEDLANERIKLEARMRSLRTTLSMHGDSTVQTVERQVRFEVSELPIPNAWVARDPNTGVSTIFMTAEYRLAITYLADSDIVSAATAGYFKCNMAYVQRMFDALASNRARSSSGQAPLRLPSPEVYLSSASSDCRPYQARFPIDPALRAQRDAQVDMVIALGYLHELGHVARGHQPVSLAAIDRLPTNERRLNEFARLMSRSREQETQADDWASDRFVDLSSNPMVALSSVLSAFYLAFGGFDCSLEAADSHPNGYQRFARQIGRIKDRATTAGKFPNSAAIAQLIEDARSLASKAQENLKCR